MKYAQIIDGTVHNIIVWDGQTNIKMNGQLVEAGANPIGIGYTYDGNTFTPPEVDPE